MNALNIATNYPACTSGYYRVNDGQTTVCRRCPIGHRCPTPSSIPESCPAGTYAPFASAVCTTCAVGKFCPTVTHSPMDCPPGTYQLQTGQTFCKACPVGYYCPLSNLDPIPCAAGTYAPVGNLTACFSCPMGFACPSAMKTPFPVLCPPGTYSPANSDRCITCEGSY